MPRVTSPVVGPTLAAGRRAAHAITLHSVRTAWDPNPRSVISYVACPKGQPYQGNPYLGALLAIVCIPGTQTIAAVPMHERQTAMLHWGRRSQPGATYFVRCCVRDRTPVFTDLARANRVLATLQRLHDDGDGEMVAAIVMPEHTHALFTLGSRLRLGQVVAKFKSLIRMRDSSGWSWQEDAFEHEVRSGDPIEDFGLYIFMNPYRAGLIGLQHRWPYWFCPDPKRFLFLNMFDVQEPVPEAWLEKSTNIRARFR